MSDHQTKPISQQQLACLRWFSLFILNPQEQHGLNNALLRALLAKHPLTAAADPEDNNHIHINNLGWAVPAPGYSSAAADTAKLSSPTYPQAYASATSECGMPLEASDSCIYLETEKHIICLVNEWFVPLGEVAVSQYESLREQVAQIAQAQNKQALVFYVGKGKPAEGLALPTICQIGNEELQESFHSILETSRGEINMPGNNPSNQFLPLVDMLLGGEVVASSQADKLAELHNELAPAPQASQMPAEYPHADLYIARLQELCNQQSKKLAEQQVTSHCWLWYPLKFANRKLADGLPFVVYEIEHGAIGKITLDLHYYVADAGANYWRMDVFRRPGRQGPDIQELLKERGIAYSGIDKHEHYVPKYIVIKQDEADNPTANLPEEELAEAAAQIQQQVDSIIHKLVSAT